MSVAACAADPLEGSKADDTEVPPDREMCRNVTAPDQTACLAHKQACDVACPGDPLCIGACLAEKAECSACIMTAMTYCADRLGCGEQATTAVCCVLEHCSDPFGGNCAESACPAENRAMTECLAGDASDLCTDYMQTTCLGLPSEWTQDEEECDATSARAVGECTSSLGWTWNGSACVELHGCTCEGSDCNDLMEHQAGCLAACVGRRVFEERPPASVTMWFDCDVTDGQSFSFGVVDFQDRARASLIEQDTGEGYVFVDPEGADVAVLNENTRFVRESNSLSIHGDSAGVDIGVLNLSFPGEDEEAEGTFELFSSANPARAVHYERDVDCLMTPL